MSNQSSTFVYNYDGPASNDAAHSNAVATTNKDNRYTPAASEYRGNSTVQEQGPDGRLSLYLYYQDDERKGNPNTTIVMTQNLSDTFQTLDAGKWTVAPSNQSAHTIERFQGDNDLKITNLNADWSSVSTSRSSSTLKDASGFANSLLVQFNLSKQDTNDNPGAILAITTGAWGTSSYKRWGVKVEGGKLYGYRCSINDIGDNCVTDTTPLISTFNLDKWYVLQIAVDDDDYFMLRVWERDNPGSACRKQETDRNLVPNGQEWKFIAKTYDGITRLDEYREGRIYSLDDSFFTSEVQPHGTLPANPDGGEYGDLKIIWTYVNQEKTLSFEGDASWTGVQNVYQYNTSEQNGTQYGNLTRVYDQSWNGSAFVNYRSSRTWYYPNVDKGHDLYLIGLPGRSNNYQCPSGSCDYGTDDVLGSHWYLYDGATSYNALPSAGKLTGERSLIRCLNADCTDANKRYSDVAYAYDSWGNSTSVTAYAGEGTTSGLWQGTAQATTTIFDSAYHTYPVAVTNALGQATTSGYDYAAGAPNQVTDANGATTYAWYDAHGRLVKVARPGDSESSATILLTYNDVTPFWTEAKQKIEGSAYATVRKFYNGQGQMIQSQTIGAQVTGYHKGYSGRFLV